MISLETETVLTLADAAKRLPARRSGKKPHISCLYRWAQDGVCGVRLETIRVGGTLCTSLEALQRFCNKCTSPNVAPTSRITRVRERQIREAETELARAGI